MRAAVRVGSCRTSCCRGSLDGVQRFFLRSRLARRKAVHFPPKNKKTGFWEGGKKYSNYVPAAQSRYTIPLPNKANRKSYCETKNGIFPTIYWVKTLPPSRKCRDLCRCGRGIEVYRFLAEKKTGFEGSKIDPEFSVIGFWDIRASLCTLYPRHGVFFIGVVALSFFPSRFVP